MSPRLALALALVATLLLLARAATGGALAIGGAALVLILGSAGFVRRRRDQRPSLTDSFLGVLPPVVGVGVAVAMLLQLAFSPAPPPGLAWFARVLCIASATLLFRTPPQTLVLHGLTILLGLWTTSALSMVLDPITGAGTLIALALAMHSLILARSDELRSSAAGSVSVGVAPTPWGLRRSRWPAIAVTLLSLVPFAFDWELPRLRMSRAQGPAVSDAAPELEATQRTSGVRRVGFSPSLALDAGRDGLSTPNERVALVTATPAPTVLFLRGATLAQATDAGFVTGSGPASATPRVSISTRDLRLDVDLFSAQHGYLFHTGVPGRWSGVDSRQVGDSFLAASGTDYPLRYSVTCRVAGQSVGSADLTPASSPALRALPSGLQTDPRIARLVDELGKDPSAPRRAAAVMQWLAKNARYDGTHPVKGRDLTGSVTSFLFESRKGICVEFATAAAVLLRLLDVPTRVIIGYRTHEMEEGRFVVRSRHAHAWVEVAYDGAGWVTYDPTPAEPLPIGNARGNAATQAAAVQATTPTRGAGHWLLSVLVVAALAGLAGWAIGRQRLAAHVRLAQLARDSVASPALLGDRARFFGLLEARGFDLEGAQTPSEWVADWPTEPELREAIEHYTFLRFSGRAPDGRVAAFRRNLDALR